MEMNELFYMHKEWLWSRLTGNPPRLRPRGCARLTGEAVDGGYISINSPDLPGFRFLLRPDESEDMSKATAAITAALNIYIGAYLSSQAHRDIRQASAAKIKRAEMGHRGKPMHMVAELC